MKVFITGVRGFLGSSLAAALRAEGHVLTGSTREPRDGSAVRLRLGESPAAGTFCDVDVVVHAIYDPRAGVEANVAGTLAIERVAGARQVFVSSYSARPDSPSDYGRMKYRLEQEFLKRGHTIVRPGLVTGGGMFLRLLKGALRLPVVPLVEGGRDLVPILDVSDFNRAMAKIVAGSGERREWNLFDPELIESRRVVAIMLREAGHKALLLPLPSALLIAGLTVAARLKLVPPGAAGGVRAARLNRTASHASHLAELVPDYVRAERAIENAVRRHLEAGG